MDWINTLAAGGVSVARAIPSDNGKLAVIHRDFDVDHIDDPWCARFMRGRRRLIESGAPYIDFDFESLTAAA